jgi:TetR/AcrR family transcriptional regulator, regulator of cefoperazone and chloramphenicol sensitivity
MLENPTEQNPTEPESDTRGARTRLALVKTAAEVFGEGGLESATTREIARRSGQNSAAIAYHFGGKDRLYLAVMHYVVGVIEQRVAPMLERAERFLAAGRWLPAACLEHLSELLQASVANSKDPEMVALTGIIVREQTSPTAAFEVLYRGVLGRLQSTGTRLMAAYVTGDPEAPGFSVRFHALLGQALAFRLARSTVMRSAGWKAIGEKQEAVIRAVVLEQSALVLSGLRRRHNQEMK